MKDLIRQLATIPFKKERVSLLLLAIISLSIWFGGPLIAIADSMPLAMEEKRFYLILFLFIAWFFKIYFYDSAPLAETPTFTPNLSDLENKIKTLTDKFAGLVGFLNKTFITKNNTEISLSALPWFLLIGPQGSGKTTLLANANVHFLLAKKFNPANLKMIAPSNNCDWWVTREMVLVDVPGTYMNSKIKKAANASQPEALSNGMLWNTFVNLVKKFRGKQALNGVVIALSLSDLMDQQKKHREQVIHDLKQRIYELHAQFGNHLPFYLIITKCDSLPGFTEFFSDSGTDELSQAWGVTLPKRGENEKLSDVFLNRFDALIKRLNKQLITRLHQERNPLARTHIKDFPLHIERMKENLLTLLQTLASADKHFHLQSIYLTSAIQQSADELAARGMHARAAATTAKAVSITVNTPLPSRPYFIRQLLLQGLTASPAEKISKPLWRWQHRPLVYATAAFLTLVAAFIIGKEFKHSLKQTNAIRYGLAHYQAVVNQNSYDINGALPLLNALEDKVKSTSHLFIFHSAKSKANAREAYRQALQTIVFSKVKSSFENYLQTTADKNPEDVYNVLKAYVELGDTDHLQPDFVIATLKKIAPAAIGNENTAAVLHHLQATFKMGLPPVTLDGDVLLQTRRYLLNLSTPALGFIILKNSNGNDTPVSLPLTRDKAAATKENSVQIPKMFTAEFFLAIYSKQTENAALEAIQGNWILGNNSLPVATPNYAPLVEQLRSLYVTNYVFVWENLLANTKLAAPKNLTETDAIVANLISANSPLLEVIHIIRKNTLLAPITAASAKLAAIDTQQDKMLTNIITTLRLLHADLQKTLTSHNVANAAFQNAAERMQEQPRQEINDPITQLHKLADSSPEPIKSWMHNIASQSWHFTLQEAGRYAENHWQSDVMSTYHSQFENRFPLWSDAAEEIPVSQFVKFLNPQGTVSSYFKSFLQPFVESKNGVLRWKKMDNQQIPFSESSLENLQLVQSLQSVFFPANNNELTLKFTLQPYFIGKNTQSVALTINGETFMHDRSMPAAVQTMRWSNDQSVHNTKINMTSRVNKPLVSVINGEWGWFRLVKQSTTKILSPHQLELSFNLDNHAAKYFLFTKGTENPFLALPHLRLPEQL